MIDSYLYHDLIIACAVETLSLIAPKLYSNDDNDNDYDNDNVHSDKFRDGFARIHRRWKCTFKERS